jgi:hypothetical protein
MPARAFTLIKNLGGALSSNTSERLLVRGDDKDSSPTLWDSEELGVESSPRETIPDRFHFTDEAEEVSSSVGSKETWNVFQHDPPRASSFHNVKESKGQR